MCNLVVVSALKVRERGEENFLVEDEDGGMKDE